MKSNICGKILFLALSLPLLVHCSSHEVTDGPVIGKAAPAFNLPSLDGQQVSLKNLKGKIVLLDFWATWCGPCRFSMPILERVQKDYGSELVLVAINLQEPLDVVRSYVSRENLKSLVLLDEEGSVGYSYRTESIPMHVLIDREGIIRHIQVGISPRMEGQLREEIRRLQGAD